MSSSKHSSQSGSARFAQAKREQFSGGGGVRTVAGSLNVELPLTDEELRSNRLNTFEQAVSESDAIFIVGTGLSAATSGNAPTATWIGLVKSGCTRARRLNPTLGQEWEDLVEGLLNYGARNQASDTVIKAAGMVSNALKDIGELAFSQWLDDDIGKLRVKSREAARALMSYPFPILTTNYDTLLEQVGDRNARDWTDVRGFHEVVTRHSEAIGHLHGVWSNPASVVLSEGDYAELSRHESTQALERAIASLKSIVYVGFGGGLSDPNFSSLLAWHRATFPESGVTHFRLCTSGEQDELLRLHANENVTPVVYGGSFEDLGPFLASHVPASAALATNEIGLARDVVQESRDMLRDSMTNESVLVEAGGGDLVGRDLVIPPVLLPVPHATFVRERMRHGHKGDFERLDGYSEVEAHDFFVVVGDDGSGLTTAVKWLATQSSEVLGSAAPLFVRFTDCRVRHDPLGAAMNNAAMTSGLIRDRDGPLPPHVMAIDDFNPAVPRLSDAVLGQLVASPAIVKVIGCRQGDEDELTSNLRALGVAPRVLFLGRMRKVDIAALADKLAPGQGAHLAHEALQVLEAEGLRRTPMTVSLLLFLLLRGGSHETRNQTSMLDAYTALLLGIGDPHENETGLTEIDLEAVLANLAESTIWDEKPSLDEPEATRVIGEVIKKYGWTAKPSAVLSFFLQRRLLRRHGDAIEFARYAYLTLFAAKRATVDKDFRDLIVNDLFYYQPVATKLAALSRGDEDFLRRLQQLLQEELAEVTAPGSPYESTPLITINELPLSEDLASTHTSTVPPPEDELEFPESNSTGSFGLVKAEMPLSARLHRSLSLISNVIRDLDQVENLSLKRQLLVDTLELWGRFITVLSADSSLTDLKHVIAGRLGVSQEENNRVDDGLVDFLSRSIPAGTAIGGIEASLVSPKLSFVFNDALARGELSTTNERLTASLLFLYLMKSDGWAEQAMMLVEGADSTWVLTHFFHTLCQEAYVQGAVPEDALLALCKSIYLKRQVFASADIRSAHLDLYAQRLRSARARAKFAPTP